MPILAVVKRVSGESPVFCFIRYLLRSRIAHLLIRLRKVIYGRKPVNPGRILLISLFGIGDAIMQTPAIELIRKRYPSAHLTVVTRKNNREIFVNNPNIDEILLYHLSNFGKISFKEVTGSLKILLFSRGYDLALLDVTGGKLRGKIAAILFGARYLVSDDLSEPESNFLADELVSRGECTHVVKRNLFMVESYAGGINPVFPDLLKPGVIYTSRERAAAEEFLRRHRIEPRVRIMAIHVGSGGTLSIHKRWPIERFLELAAGLMEISPAGRIILFRGPGESGVDFAPFVQKGCIIAENLTLLEIAALLHRAYLFIGNDSGLAHLASSQGVPSVVLFGPTDEREVRPYGKNVSVVFRSMDCRPCWGLPGYLQACQGQVDCLASLETEVVLEAASSLMKRSQAPNLT